MRNWSGHVEFGSTQLLSPTSVTELQQMVARGPRVRALGTGHSFNDIADTSGAHVSVGGLPRDIEIHDDVAWLPAGMRYGTAARILDNAGWAVHNMASLGHISIGGTVATGTHGSGDRNPTLSASVVGLELVTASGDMRLIRLDSEPDALNASVVSLGCVGVVTRVAVRIEPAFTMRQYVFDDVPLDSVLDDFDDLFSSAYSVSYFTTWSPTEMGQVWMKQRVDREQPWSTPDWMGGHLATEKRHPLPGHDAVHCTEQLGEPGPWHERLPHFRLDFTPSSGDELQTEYLVPRANAVAALRDVAAHAPEIHALLHVSEIRTMCADDLWLSGAYGRDTVGIHFTWRKTDAVLPLLPVIDTLLAGHGGRPHWGKLFEATGPLGDRYPRFADFARVVEESDPAGKFRNRFIDALLDGM